MSATIIFLGKKALFLAGQTTFDLQCLGISGVITTCIVLAPTSYAFKMLGMGLKQGYILQPRYKDLLIRQHPRLVVPRL